MRSIPLRLVLALLICCIVVPAVGAPVVFAKKDLKQQASSTKADVKRLTEQERTLHKDLAGIEDDMDALEKKIAGQEKKLAGLEKEEAAIGEKRDALEARRKETAKELTVLLRKLWPIHVLNKTQRGRAMESWDQADREFTWLAAIYKRVGVKMEDIREQNAALEATMQEQKKAADQARAELAAVNQDKDRLLEHKLDFNRRIAEVRKEKLSKEEELDQVLAAIQKMEYKLRREAERKAEEARQKKEAEEARKAEIARKAEEARKKAEAERLAEKKTAKVEQARAKFTLMPMPSVPPKKAVGGLKGRMPWPVERGNVRIGFKASANPPHRGVGLAVHEGEPVRAVAFGKVVHTDTMRGYGKVVVLVHGEEYYSLYAYLAETKVDLGEEVEAGQEIGTAGYFPELKGPGLYFELRFHQKAINPKAWLASLK
ncbi:murein hydrolase activator EnvC family protein [Oceanidesulfovibrio marinus]|nr:peptidoglycan DD-metalloendopeptidase family protein [Oceanidesulfovibrio marinus]